MLFYQPQASSGTDFLDEEESRHAVKVLRLKELDPIRVIDGKGVFYDAQITEASPKKCRFIILDSHTENPDKKHYIHLAIAPTKNPDRMEWFTEKSVEFGVDEITFLICEHSERKQFNIGRIEKKAISAMKQSLKATLPLINPPILFSKFMEEYLVKINRFIAYVDQDIPQHLQFSAKPHEAYCVLIGPEGDFSSHEIALASTKGFTPVSLGRSRLRTETAGIGSCHILNLINNF
ncbi:MAG: 16S rRNA (uracil(1498)-N(3))-methyltransferase [Bacteroidota bacterium]|nr:16S rRNA (uracil(1498)-N(3))-methyltransferase [Bacteroidota bacterium]